MQSARVMLPLAFFACALQFLSGGWAQSPPGNGRTNQASFYKFLPIEQVRKGVDAWPLIVNANDAASQRVNATLKNMNDKLAQALSECDTNYFAWTKDVGHESEGKGNPTGDWERKVEVTMAGPQFLSIVATDTFISCGGAYPDSDRNAMVFDMSTGDPVDWAAMIAKTAGASSIADTAYDGTEVGALILPALEKINLAAASPECKDAFDNQQLFLIWPDAQKEQLVAIASGLPHVVAACEQEIHLTMEQARALGFDETIIDSIESAHRRSMAKPKP